MPARQNDFVAEYPRYEREAYRTVEASRERVCLTLRVDSIDALNVRLELHRVLQDRIGVYIMNVDHVRGITTLQLQTRRDHIDAIMQAVMSGLPHAEFGPIRETALASVH